MSEIQIGGRLHSIATGNVVTGADEILYEPTNGIPKKQSEVNAETYEHMASIDAALQELSPDQTEAIALATDVNDLKGNGVRSDAQALTEIQKAQVLANIGINGIDSTPTIGSDNLIKSGGVLENIDEKTISNRVENKNIALNLPTKGNYYFDYNFYPNETYIIEFDYGSQAAIRTFNKNNEVVETIPTIGSSRKIVVFTATQKAQKIGGYFNTSNDFEGILTINHIVKYTDFPSFEDGAYVIATGMNINKISTTDFICAKLIVEPGMKFEIRGKGATYSRWLWGTSNNGTHLIRGAGSSASDNNKLLEPVIITIEDGEKYLYINFLKDYADGSYIHLLNSDTNLLKNSGYINNINKEVYRNYHLEIQRTCSEGSVVQYNTSKPNDLPQKVLIRVEDSSNIINGGYGITNFAGSYPFGSQIPVNKDFVFNLTEDFFGESSTWGVYISPSKVVGSGSLTIKFIYNYGDTLNERVDLLEKTISDKEIVIDTLKESDYTSVIEELDSIQKVTPDYSISSFDEVIEINNQNDFGYIDNGVEVNVIKQSINSAISNGKKNILVLFKADRLYYFEKHLNFIVDEYPNAQNVKIKLQGINGCVFIASGRDYTLSDAASITGNYYNYTHETNDIVRTIYLSEDNKELSHISKMRATSKLIEAVSYMSGSETLVDEARIFLEPGDIVENPTHIMLTHRFWNATFPVVVKENGDAKIVDGWLHFTAKPISMSVHSQFYTGNFTVDNLNYDYPYGVLQRYKLININSGDVSVHNNNIQINLKHNYVHECVSQTFIQIGKLYGVNGTDTKMRISYCPFNSVEIAGLTFIGNADYGVNNYNPQCDQNSLIRIDAFNGTGIYIHDNTFRNIRSKICGIGGYFIDDGVVRPTIDKDDIVVQKVLFSNNKAYDCYLSMLDASQYTKTIYCIGNYAKNMNRAMYYDGVFGIIGQDFLIRDNKCEDFCWGAVRSGIENANLNTSELVAQYASEGIVEHNEFGWSKEYADDAFEHSMIDIGVIYTYCRNKRFIVRDNVVYNYKSLGVSHGIYIDGYAENAKVYRNIVINSGNSRSIILYRNDSDASADYKRSNNNLLAFNVVTSSYEFTSFNDCIKAQNYLMLPNNAGEICKVDGPEKEDDYIIPYAKTVGNVISIPSEYKNIVNQIPISTKMKARIVFDYH